MDRNFPGNQLWSNVHQPILLEVDLTAAADTEASGYTINKGSGFVTSASRSAEGILQVTFNQKVGRIVNAIVSLSKDDTTVTADHASWTTSLAQFTFRTGAADTDPDSATIRITFILENSGQGLA
jgi:hypothetical protein